MRRSILAFASLWMAATYLGAAPVGAVKGSITDATGAYVPNASVELQNASTNLSLKTTTNSSGFYQFLSVPPGTYSLTVTATGFHKDVVNEVAVLVDQIVSLDLKMEVGAVTEILEVHGGAVALIEPEKSSTGAAFDLTFTANLPQVNRRFNDLALLTPGVTFSAPGSQVNGIAAAGSRSQSTNWMIDGVTALDPQVNGVTNNLRINEAVQEFSVTTSVASAEFGRQSGAQVNLVTKSGTNQFHGSLFEFLRNDKLQAADFFTNKLSGVKPPLRRNQFGGSVGGRIIRDKTFFFYSWEALKVANPVPASAIVPTAAQRAAIKDPIAAAIVKFYPLPTDTSQPAGKTNFVGNLAQRQSDNTHLVRIDHALTEKDRLSGRYIWNGGTSVSAQSPATLPGFSTTNAPGTQNLALSDIHTVSPTFLVELRAGYARNKTDIKVEDAGLNAASILTGVPGVVDAAVNSLDSGLPRVVITGYTSLGGATNLPQGRITNSYELALNATKVAPFGSSRQTLKFGWSGRREETRRFLDGNSRGSVTFNDFDSFAGICTACGGQSLLLTSTIRTGDTLGHWYRYAHAFYLQDDIKVKSNLTVNLGLRYELPSAVTEKRGRGSNFVPGVGVVLDGTNQLLDLNPTLKGRSAFVFKTAPITLPAGGTNPDNNNFGPVVGFAYTPKLGKGWLGDGKTVIRGGFRVGFDEVFNNIPVNQSLNAPFVLTTTQRAGTTQPAAGYGWNLAFDQNIPLVARTSQAPGLPAVGLVSYNGIDVNARSSYVYNWNFGIQRQIGSGSAIDISYIGTGGHKLGAFVDLNQPFVTVRDSGLRGNQAPNEQLFPFPQWSNAFIGANLGNSTYSGLVISGKLRVTSLLTMNSSYTWSHSIDNVSSFFGSTTDISSPADSRNFKVERGNGGNDQRFRFINAFVLDLPVGKGHKFLGSAHGVEEQVLGGWSISAITNLSTGVPFTIYGSTTQDFSGFNQLVDRPDVVGSGALTIDRGNPDNFFDTPFFGKVTGANCPGSTTNKVVSGCAPTGRVGTSPRNAYYGPGLISLDTTVGKTFPIHEDVKLEFRSDFINLVNHTNFALTSGNRTMSSGQFGQLSSSSLFNGGDTGGPRVIQMTLRLHF